MRGKLDHSRQRGLRRTQTEAEIALWQHLRNRRLLGMKFRRQHRVGAYVADFICLQAKLVIELDGNHHLNQIEYDQTRTAYLQQCGLHVIRFWNDDVFLRMQFVLDQIANALDCTRPSSGASRHLLPAYGEKDF